MEQARPGVAWADEPEPTEPGTIGASRYADQPHPPALHLGLRLSGAQLLDCRVFDFETLHLGIGRGSVGTLRDFLRPAA